eukprot:ANDGO_04502.mRNA.1 Protein dcd1A
MKLVVALAAFVVFSSIVGSVIVVAQTADCGGAPRNTKPIITDAPVKISATPNGERWLAGTGEDAIHLLYVKGSFYEMGYAQGELMKKEFEELVPEFFQYIEAEVDQILSKVPKWMVNFIVKNGLNAALDLTWDATTKYTPQRYYDEMKGLADATGIDLVMFRRLAMFPELTKAACSMFGAWGNATASRDGKLLQLRALDWDAKCVIKKWPSVTVYFPNAKEGGHPFAVIGWPGMVGTIGTGYSSTGVALSEKVWLNTPKDVDSRFGMPWTFVLRDVLQFAGDLDAAITQLVNAHRTCSIHVGVGDKNTNEFRGVEYAANVINIYDDKNQPVYPQHPYMPNLVYWDKHPQPTTHDCYSSLLEKFYGSFTAENTISDIAAVSRTGDMHIAVYDFATEYVYVANAAVDESSGVYEAFTQSFVRFDMAAIFAHQF